MTGFRLKVSVTFRLNRNLKKTDRAVLFFWVTCSIRGFIVSRHSLKVGLGSHELRTCCEKTSLDITGCIKGQRKPDVLSVRSKYVGLAPLMLKLLVFIFVETQVLALLAEFTLSFLTAEYKMLFSGDLPGPRRADPSSI